jgi:hypothetical protein
MDEQPASDAPEHEDHRATDEPSQGEPEHDPAEGAGESPADEQPGPMGNPAVDEEALRNRQQDES